MTIPSLGSAPWYLGTFPVAGRVLFKTPTEYCIMLVGEWTTVRIPTDCLSNAPSESRGS